jgi:hypothetical protein
MKNAQEGAKTLKQLALETSKSTSSLRVEATATLQSPEVTRETADKMSVTIAKALQSIASEENSGMRQASAAAWTPKLNKELTVRGHAL